MARILVVDDDTLFRSTLVAALDHSGHIVLAAPDGITAAHVVKAEPVDVIVTDVHMPEQKGIEMITLLRAAKTCIPIIAMTGSYAHTQVFQKAATLLGAERVFAKPFRMAELLDAIDELIPAAPSQAGAIQLNHDWT
ncbi:MAG: response regulator transcription factor [Opitutaceae bacterium]